MTTDPIVILGKNGSVITLGEDGSVSVEGTLATSHEVWLAGVHAVDAQAKAVSTAIRKILDRLDLTDEQKARSRQVVIDVLREKPDA